MNTWHRPHKWRRVQHTYTHDCQFPPPLAELWWTLGAKNRQHLEFYCSNQGVNTHWALISYFAMCLCVFLCETGFVSPCAYSSLPVVCWGLVPGPRPPWQGCSSGTLLPHGRPAVGSRWHGVGPLSWQLSCMRKQTCPQSASTWCTGKARLAPETSLWCPILAEGGPG